jgi:hypothetical protein
MVIYMAAAASGKPRLCFIPYRCQGDIMDRTPSPRFWDGLRPGLGRISRAIGQQRDLGGRGPVAARSAPACQP